MSCRLLYVVGQLRAGGLEQQLCHLLHAMNREHYRPAVAVWHYQEEDVHVAHLRTLGVPLYALPTGASGAAKLRVFRQLTKQLRPEIIHSYSFHTNFAAWWGARGTNAIAIGAIRSEFARAVRENGPWLGRMSARWPRVQICNNIAAAEHLGRSKGLFTPGQLYVVRNGVDLRHFRAVSLAAEGPARIIGVGSLFAVKRWDRLVRVAHTLKQAGFEFEVQIVGDGPLRASLTQQAKALNVGECVRFLGHRDDLPGLLAESMCLVHTSESEGCPNVVLEAMACGRAVIATDAGDVPSLIEDGKTGFVVPRDHEERLTDRIALLITDRDLCRRMGEAGRAKAEREFGLDRLVAETLAVYRSAGWRDA